MYEVDFADPQKLKTGHVVVDASAISADDLRDEPFDRLPQELVVRGHDVEGFVLFFRVQICQLRPAASEFYS